MNIFFGSLHFRDESSTPFCQNVGGEEMTPRVCWSSVMRVERLNAGEHGTVFSLINLIDYEISMLKSKDFSAAFLL